MHSNPNPPCRSTFFPLVVFKFPLVVSQPQLFGQFVAVVRSALVFGIVDVSEIFNG